MADAKEVRKIRDLAVKHGVNALFDDLVADCMAKQASDINNGGADEQIYYLLGQLGYDELRRQIEED